LRSSRKNMDGKKMSKKTNLLLLSILFLIISSCAVRKTGRQTEVIKIEPEETLKVDTIKVEKDTLPVTIEDTTKKSTEPEFTFAPQKEEEKKRIFGYRVQIFAFSERERAEAAKEEAQLILDQPVYVEYVPGFDGEYKVRVGDFISRDEAIKYRDYLRRKGYPDAFIVETYITVH